ncbi:YraN family protein [Candidatus Saccharibacteria bacterium]|nr:YraN family protein [Candidatus Saccharibacteria bacterium]
MTNYSIGRYAEQVASEYLMNNGYKIVDRNWRTRWCEIDIVAHKNNCLYFCEVKYRKNTNHGHGLEYITKNKITKMQLSAELWVNTYSYEGDYSLSAISISGDNFILDSFIQSIT